MFGLNFTRLPKPRKFNYKPVYYDEDMEDLHERVARAKSKKEINSNKTAVEIKENIRNNFKRKYESEYSSTPDTFRKMRILLIAIVLGVILYQVFNSELIDKIITGFLVK
jgi:hypothetical protein